MKSPNVSPVRPLEPRQKAIVLGASSGIGEAIARRLAREGYDVALLARRGDRLQVICDEINESGFGMARAYVHDVLMTDQIQGLYRRITSELGGLDLFVYAAGVMFPVSDNLHEPDHDTLVLQVNLIGAVLWLSLVSERFLHAGTGHIVGIGSVAGYRGRRGAPAYAASKAGLHTYLEGLRNRIAHDSVSVTTVVVGQVATEMLKNTDRILRPISILEAAELIWRGIDGRRQTVFVPAWWAPIALIVRHLPSFVLRRLNI